MQTSADSTYPDTVRTLVDSYGELSPELRKAAQYMLEHPEEVGLSSMRSVAKAAGVKPATISRLSRALGYSEYSQLREPFRQRLRGQEPDFAARLRDVQQRGSDDAQALFEEHRALELRNIERSLGDDQLTAMLDAVDTLGSSRRVYVLGLRGAFAPAFVFHYAFQLFREGCHLLDTRAGIFADQLRGIGDRDAMLVISFPPYTQLTIDALNYAAEAGVKLIAVTDSAVSPAAKAATHTIVTQNASPSFYHSLTGALAVCQGLITLLVAKSGADAVKIVEEAEQQLSRISAYW